MNPEETLPSLPWHLLAKKRSGIANPAELAELEAWLTQHAPPQPAPRPDEAAQAWARMQARARRHPPKA